MTNYGGKPGNADKSKKPNIGVSLLKGQAVAGAEERNGATGNDSLNAVTAMLAQAQTVAASDAAKPAVNGARISQASGGGGGMGMGALRDELSGALEQTRQELSSRVGGLEEQMAALRESVGLILERLPAKQSELGL